MLGPDAISLVVKRADFITELADRPLEKRELTEELEYSRATVNRAIGELEDAGLVRDTPAGHQPTIAATLAVETYHEFVATETDILDAREVLAGLDHDAAIAPELLRDADRFSAADTGTYANFERVRDALSSADAVDVVVPSERALPVLDHWQNALVAADDATVVLDEALRDSVADTHRSLAWLTSQGVDVLAGDVPAFVVVRTTDADGARAFVLAYDEDAGGFGAIRNDSANAVDWATAVLESCRTDANAVTNEFDERHARGATPGGDGTRRGLPRVLEAEGFVDLSTSLERREARDFATALRTGFTLADVRAGHAIDRDATDGSTAESLADEVHERLEAGEDCALVGPPGAGKSTVCKAVACQWDADDRGRVLYRASGQRNPFESVASLRAVVRETTEDVLVVVEDAVRPEANAVLDVAAAYASADDVQFLVDARESDWSETRRLPVDAAVREYKNNGFDVTTVSRPAVDECTRLLNRYETETGRTLDVTGAELLDAVTDATAVSGGMCLLAHHVCLHANPMSTDDDVTPTPLVEDVQRRLERLQHDAPDVALDAALLTQFLNAAERPVHEEFLQAQALDDAVTTDGILSALTDQQLVVDEQGSLATPHGQWSRVFLTEALDVLVDAPERFGRALDVVLALTDADVRQGVDARTRNSEVLQRIAAAPTDWADDLVETVLGAIEEQLELRAYFGTFENPTFDLRGACSDETVFECGYQHARRVAEASDLHEAEAAFRTVLDAIANHEASSRFERQRANCLLDLGWVLGRQGDLDAYVTHARSAMDLHREHGTDHGVGRCHLGLAHVASRRRAFETSREHARTAASLFEELGDLERRARCLAELADTAMELGEFETAQRRARESLEVRRELGTQFGLANSYMALGRIAERRGEYEDAMRHHRQSLVAADSAGTNRWRVVALNNMGHVAMHLGRLDESLAYFERAADRNEAVGEPRYDAIRNETLSEVARRRGEIDTAETHAETALEQAMDGGFDRVEAIVRLRLGQLAFERADFEVARDELTTALETFRDGEEDPWRLQTRVHLARLELEAGDLERASEHATRAVDLEDATGDLASDARARCVRGRVLVARGDREGARECFADLASFVDDVTDPYVRATVHLELGRFERADGDEAAAREHLETAEALDEDVGAKRLSDDAADALEGEPSAPAPEE